MVKTERTIDKVLYKCDCKFGAPMGRLNIGNKPTNKKIYDCCVNLIEGYDKGGAYWATQIIYEYRIRKIYRI